MANSKKDIGRSIVKWFENTLIDPDVIMNHFGIPKNKKKRTALRELANEVRRAKWGDKWGR